MIISRKKILALSVALVAVACFQQERGETASLTPGTIERPSPEEVTELEREFELADSVRNKQQLAVRLVGSADSDDRYMEFLIERAQAAVEADSPFPFEVDEEGQAAKTWSRELLAWAAELDLEPSAAAGKIIHELYGDILLLAASWDERGLEVLLKALESDNHYIAVAAAEGLGRIGARETLPRIMAAAERGRVMSIFYAMALTHFDERAADELARELYELAGIDGDQALAERKAEIAKMRAAREGGG